MSLKSEAYKKKLTALWPEMRALREGEIMGAYTDFDRKADKDCNAAEYLVKFGKLVSERTVEVNKEPLKMDERDMHDSVHGVGLLQQHEAQQVKAAAQQMKTPPPLRLKAETKAHYEQELFCARVSLEAERAAFKQFKEEMGDFKHFQNAVRKESSIQPNQKEAVKKPPTLGLRPAWIANHTNCHNRIIEIVEAMSRYSQDGVPVPKIWCDELKERIEDMVLRCGQPEGKL